MNNYNTLYKEYPDCECLVKTDFYKGWDNHSASIGSDILHYLDKNYETSESVRILRLASKAIIEYSGATKQTLEFSNWLLLLSQIM